jgi:hypothetical protein
MGATPETSCRRTLKTFKTMDNVQYNCYVLNGHVEIIVQDQMIKKTIIFKKEKVQANLSLYISNTSWS